MKHSRQMYKIHIGCVMKHSRQMYKIYFLPTLLTNQHAKGASSSHMWSESCMMIGQLGWEKIDVTELSNVWRLCCVSVLEYLDMHHEKGMTSSNNSTFYRSSFYQINLTLVCCGSWFTFGLAAASKSYCISNVSLLIQVNTCCKSLF